VRRGGKKRKKKCTALGPFWAGTRAQSGDRYRSGTLHPGQVLRSSLPLLSPAFRHSHFLPPGASTSATTPEILAAKGGTMGEKSCPVILPTWCLYSCHQGSFTCHKYTTWDRQLYFPSEERHAADFFCP
jgi:hypothetical protein